MSSVTISEDEALFILSQELGSTRRFGDSSVELGIGDDCAILKPTQDRIVVTTDACTEGSHFLWEWMAPDDIAHKSIHAAISDVCAMGGRPRVLTVQLTLTERVTGAFLKRFARAQRLVCETARVAIVGGNVTFGRDFSVVTTALGEVKGQPLLRATARVGDEIWLLGEVGLARAGLLLLQRGTKKTQRRSFSRCLEAFRRPQAQLKAGPALLGKATACLDLSDGLATDLPRLERASSVRIDLAPASMAAIVTPELREACQILGVDPEETAWVGGEDYALLATGPSAARPRAARVLGRVQADSKG